MSLKLLHLADVHIGLENYGRIDPATGLHTRLLDFVKCLSFAVDRALEERVDCVLFAGDAYRTCTPNPTQERAFAEQIRRLSERGIPVVMIPGNHDLPVAFGRATAIDIFAALDIEHVTVVTKPEIVRLETAHGPVQVLCFPWPTRSTLMAKEEYKDLPESEVRGVLERICARLLEQLAKQVDPAVPSILLAHLAAAQATYAGSERSTMIGSDPVFQTSTLANPAFDYVALGHLHKHQDLNPSGKPHVVYPGSIERIDFGEAGDSKGFCLVSIAQPEEGPSTPATRTTTYQFVETPARPFRSIEVTIGEHEDPTEKILRELRRHDLVGAVVRVTYTCTEEQSAAIDLRAVRAALEPAFFVAGLARRLEPKKAPVRVEITEHIGILEALDKYIDSHPELWPLREDLKTYAQRLEEEG